MSSSLGGTTIDSKVLTTRPQQVDMLPEIQYNERILQRVHVLFDRKTWFSRHTLALLSVTVLCLILMKNMKQNCPSTHRYLLNPKHLIVVLVVIVAIHYSWIHAMKRVYTRYGTVVDAAIVRRLYVCEHGWDQVSYQFFTDRGQPMEYTGNECQMTWTELDRRARANNYLGGLVPNHKIFSEHATFPNMMAGNDPNGGQEEGTTSQHVTNIQERVNQQMAQQLSQQTSKNSIDNSNTINNTGTTVDGTTIDGTNDTTTSSTVFTTATNQHHLHGLNYIASLIQTQPSPSHHILVEYRWRSQAFRKWYRVDERTYAVEIAMEVVLPPGSSSDFIASSTLSSSSLVRIPLNYILSWVPYITISKLAARSPYRTHIPFIVIVSAIFLYGYVVIRHVTEIHCPLDPMTAQYHAAFYVTTIALLNVIWLLTGPYVYYNRELFDWGHVTEMESSGVPSATGDYSNMDDDDPTGANRSYADEGGSQHDVSHYYFSGPDTSSIDGNHANDALQATSAVPSPPQKSMMKNNRHEDVGNPSLSASIPSPAKVTNGDAANNPTNKAVLELV